MKQSIPLPNAQRSLVDTGNTEELKDNVLNEKFKYPKGKVKKITETEIIFELPDKTEVSVPRRTAIQSINDVSVYVEPKVKVGQVVKEGDIIAFNKSEKGSKSVTVVHRVTKVDKKNGRNVYVTKGDANKTDDSNYVTDTQVKGVVKIRVPFIAYPTIMFNDFISSRRK